MLEAINAVIGAGHAIPGDSARVRVHGRPAAVVAEPGSTEETAALLELCSREGWTVEPAGGCTWLDAGRAPTAPVDVVITTRRIAAVELYEPADLTISVGAGMTADAVRTRTHTHRQELPLDGPAAPGATVGAWVATATAGPLRPAFGTPRDQVLGLSVVTGDGRVLAIGGRVVKNVAGYDLVRLFTGSRGTLGIITAVHVRLRGAPELDATVLLSASTEGPLLALAPTATRGLPAAVELIGPGTLPSGSAAGGPAWNLAVRQRGNREGVEDAVERLLAEGRALCAHRLAPEEATRLWNGLAASEAEAVLDLRFASLPSSLRETLGHVATVTGGADGGWRVAAHVTAGIVRAWTDRVPDGSAAAELADTIGLARSALATDGGTVQAPVLPRSVAERLGPFGDFGPGLSLMRGLKTAFDPAGILSPGRFLP